MSSFTYSAAPRSVDVLPRKARRRVTLRDGLLPLVFSLELLVGIVFGMAAHSSESAASGAPAGPSLAPVAQVSPIFAAAPVATVVPAAPPRTHAPVNPFGALVHVAGG